MEREKTHEIGPDSTVLNVGTDSTVLDPRYVANTLPGRGHNDERPEDFRTAQGITNGILLGLACWIFVYCTYRLLSL